VNGKVASLLNSDGRKMAPPGSSYKWIALSNTTLGALMATIDASIVLIALPAIFNGIGVDPLSPGESNYFLWLLLGYMVASRTCSAGCGCTTWVSPSSPGPARCWR
jgi:hypothetical protein